MASFVTVDGARIAYEQTGTGPDVVLIHAGVTDRRMWDDVVPHVMPHHRVTRFDMRGFGETVEDEEVPWAARRDLIGVMDAAGVESAAVVGVSMGGGAAVNAALEYPERITRLVAVNAAIGGFDLQPDEWEEDIEDRIGVAFREGRFDDCATLEMEMWLAGPHRTLADMDPAIVVRMREWLLISYTNPTRWSEAIRMNPPANDRLGEISAPTLAVQGELDVASIGGVMERIATGVTGAQKVLMPGMAHLPPLEAPTEFARLLLEFLD